MMANAFEQAPSEDFRFPEAATQIVSRFHGRDFQTVFRSSERGGTAFDRILLVGNTLNLQPAFTSQMGFQPANFITFVSSISNVALVSLHLSPCCGIAVLRPCFPRSPCGVPVHDNPIPSDCV